MKEIQSFSKRILWCLAFIVIGGGLYLLTNSHAETVGAYNIRFDFEKHIPLMTWTIFVYFLIFPYLAMPVFVVKKYTDFLKVVLGFWAITFISAFIFYKFPTTMVRPEIAESGIIGLLFDAIHYVDGPNNLLPSLHVSTVTYIGFVNWKFYPKWRILTTLFAVLICFSTLTVKQHAIADVLGGFVLGAVVYLVVFKLIFRDYD